EIEMFDLCFDCPCWTWRALALPQPWMEPIELPYLSVGSPSQIAPSCASQVEMRDLLEAAGRVKAGSQLVGECLVVDKAVGAGRADGLFVEPLGIDFASLDTGNLGADKCCAILKVLRTIRRPSPKLFLMSPKYLSMLDVRVGARGLAACGARQRGIEMIFRLL